MRSSSEEAKEVYAQFGLAYYHAEVLHRSLCHFYAFSQIPEEGGMTAPRMAEHLVEAYGSTLGRVVRLVLPLLPEALVPRLQNAIDQRNFLAHHIWFQRIHLAFISAGAQQLIEELTACSQEFQQLDAEIERCMEPLHQRAGLTQEGFERALDAALRGEEGEPLVEQRRPQKEEVIAAAYEVPTEGEASALVFQTEDGELWQLCDSGLGWTAYDQVAADWVPAEAFQDLLPAHVNPRPSHRVRWRYEIFFGRGTSLVVRPGPQRDRFRWSVRRKGA